MRYVFVFCIGTDTHILILSYRYAHVQTAINCRQINIVVRAVAELHTKDHKVFGCRATDSAYDCKLISKLSTFHIFFFLFFCFVNVAQSLCVVSGVVID